MKTVTISGKDVEVLANAATSIVHQRIFDEDILVEYNKLYANGEVDEENIEANAKASALIKRLAFTMAMQAKYVGHEENLMKISFADYMKWLSQFDEVFSLEEATAEIMEVYTGSSAPTAIEKKEDAPQTDK